MESSYDAWRTATPYEDDICRAEFEDDNLSVDTSFVEMEDEEIKSLISTEPSEIEEMLRIALSFKNEGNLEAFELIMEDIVKLVVSKI